MRGIVIAAGLGNRMGALTAERPKCMLPVAGRHLLSWTIDGLRAGGCSEIVVITGYQQDQIPDLGFTRVENRDFRNNNILHSLMCARDYLEGPVMVSYSDIWVEPTIHRTLAETPGDIVVAVDRDWEPYYEGRSEHPLGEAENMFVDESGAVRHAGKHLHPESAGAHLCGEFLGLWRMSTEGTRRFRAAFEALDTELTPTEPFQQAAEWRRAYITDMAQHLIDAGTRIDAALIERGWAELDTAQDYERLSSVAGRQGMITLETALASMQREDA